MRRILFSSVIFGLLASGPALHAKTPNEQFCSMIRETPDGKFKADMVAGWSLYLAQKEEGLIAFDADVRGVACMRDPNTLQPEDAEALKQGIALYFSNPKTGVTINYEAVDGLIKYKVPDGALSKSQMRKLTRSVEAAQAQM